jgi:predicted Rossmann fold nucleotide-binding protein DprA/Smf involved in DNA uptake
MTPPRQLSRSTLILIIFLSLLSAVGYKLWELKKANDQTIERLLAARNGQPSATHTQQALTFSRPWLRSTNGAALFAFTDSEWSTLTNLYPEKLAEITMPPTLIFAEGYVMKVSERVFESLKSELPASCLQTNPVWFLKP